MRTSRTTLSEPKGSDRVPEGAFGYFRSRNKHRIFSLVIREFKRRGLSQADLARRLGKGTDIVCRWLGSPGNWTLDTLSDLLFAISGAEVRYGLAYPLANAETVRTATTTTAVVTTAVHDTTAQQDAKNPPEMDIEAEGAVVARAYLLAA